MKNKIAFILLFFIVTGYAQRGSKVFGKDPLINLENFDKQRVYWGYFLGKIFDWTFQKLANLVTLDSVASARCAPQ